MLQLANRSQKIAHRVYVCAYCTWWHARADKFTMAYWQSITHLGIKQSNSTCAERGNKNCGFGHLQRCNKIQCSLRSVVLSDGGELEHDAGRARAVLPVYHTSRAEVAALIVRSMADEALARNITFSDPVEWSEGDVKMP